MRVIANGKLHVSIKQREPTLKTKPSCLTKTENSKFTSAGLVKALAGFARALGLVQVGMAMELLWPPAVYSFSSAGLLLVRVFSLLNFLGEQQLGHLLAKQPLLIPLLGPPC